MCRGEEEGFFQKNEPLLKTDPPFHTLQEQKWKFSAPIRYFLFDRRFPSPRYIPLQAQSWRGAELCGCWGVLQCHTHRAGHKATQLMGNTVFTDTLLLFYQTIAIYEGSLLS